jgi:LysR family transcriptional regulator (chromosome initiation inhibitor)
MGWGLGVMPEQMAAPWLTSGALQAVHTEVHVDVLLHWHQWRLSAGGGESATAAAGRGALAAPLRIGTLDRIGRALAEGALAALRAPG